MFRKKSQEDSSQEKEAPKKSRGKKRGKKIVIGIAVVAILLIVVKLAMGSGAPAGLPVNTQTVSRTDIRQIVALKGTIQGSDVAEIASATNKEIAAINVKEGDVVKKGQILAVLKKEDTDNQAQYDRERANRDMEAAKYAYETQKTLYEAGGASKQEYLTAKTAYENSKTLVASANSKGKTEKNEIVSPIGGTVTRVNAKVGLVANDMQNKGALFVVENLSKLQIKVSVSEYDISQVEVGQTVDITAEVLGDKVIKGVVSHVAPTGEAKDSTAKEMVIPVTIDITEADSHLIAGVTAKASILTAEVKDTISLSLDAVLSDSATGEEYVFLVEKGKLKKQVIKTGLEGDFLVQVTSDNLKEGDKVVLNPTPDMTDGTEVMAGKES